MEPDEQTWYVDDGNQDWINECIQIAYDGYERVFARRCESFRMGDGFMNTATMCAIERGGARFELTAEPGSTPSRANFFPERHTGVMPDCSDIPRDPYHPSLLDWRKPDENRPGAITVIPMSAGFIPAGMVSAESAGPSQTHGETPSGHASAKSISSDT